METKTYKALAEPTQQGDENNPRVAAVREIIGRYRGAALRELMIEYPELKLQKLQIDKARRQSRPAAGGSDPYAVLNALN